jgi:uncharacterized membrane protein YdbT with pleckstrin-like domain
MTVHPSAKLLIPWYVLAVLCAGAIVWHNARLPDGQAPDNWFYILPAFMLGGTLAAHGRRIFTRLHLEDYRLRYEAGVISKETRMMELRSLQNVRVHQNILQRILKTGNLSIEAVGGSSSITLANIDNPQSVADAILRASHEHHAAKKDE